MIGQSPIGILPIGPFQESGAIPVAPNPMAFSFAFDQVTITGTFLVSPNDLSFALAVENVVVSLVATGRYFGPIMQGG